MAKRVLTHCGRSLSSSWRAGHWGDTWLVPAQGANMPARAQIQSAPRKGAMAPGPLASRQIEGSWGLGVDGTCQEMKATQGPYGQLAGEGAAASASGLVHLKGLVAGQPVCG